MRTGYEQIIAQRTSKAFATVAKQDGRVISVRKDGIIVEYADGSRIGVELGRRFGHASSLTFPFTITTPLSAGQEFKAGDTIAYNEQFFERDFLNPGGVVYKGSLPCMVALMEAPSTYEDSSAISTRLGEQLTTSLTNVAKIVINADQAIHQLVKPGQKVSSRDVLCILEDPVTSESSLFDEDSLETLRLLAAQTPRAGTNGVVERIEVLYNAEPEDMSPTVLALVEASDKALAAKRRAVGDVVLTGRVSEGFRVDGNPLLPGTILIKVYITTQVGVSTGDKMVFGNQLKTTVGEVMQTPIVTESGVEVDAKFGSKAVGDRIVRSPYIIGTTSILLKVLAKRAARAYRGNLG